MTYGEVTTVSGVGSSHHVLCVEHLLSELWHSDSTVLLAASCGEGCETSHEEMKTRERHFIELSSVKWQPEQSRSGVPKLTASFRRSELS